MKLDLQTIFPHDLDDKLEINAIVYDSRLIQPGSVFVALPGTKVDGHDYVAIAEENGAAAVVVERGIENISIPQIVVRDSHTALSELSAALYPTDGEQFKIIGVTGTDGKTSTTSIIEQLLIHLGCSIGYIGTNGIHYKDVEFNLSCTTPLAPELHEIIYKMVQDNVSYLAMEVSSHALATKRVEHLSFDYAVFTNLSHDHLDFHKTIKHYKDSKFHLFHLLKKKGIAIINQDDAVGNEFILKLQHDGVQVETFSVLDETATIYARKINYSFTGTSFELIYQSNVYHINTKLLGDFNVQNILASILVLIHEGFHIEQLIRAIGCLQPVEGRMELIKSDEKDIAAIIDFGHAPDAIKHVLSFARKLNPSKLTVITGAVGDGDKTKRPEMAAFAAELSDRFIVTMDNPYSENPQSIIDEMVKNMPHDSYIRIDDRQQALDYAFETAVTGELIVIMGRGREDIITVGDNEIQLNDYAYVNKILK